MSNYTTRLNKQVLNGTVIHIIVAKMLSYIYRNKDNINGWKYYTYVHGMLYTGITMPLSLLYVYITRKNFKIWLLNDNKEESIKTEQLIQINNISYQIASSLVSFNKIIKTPYIFAHHLLTIFASYNMLDPRASIGYGTLITSIIEIGSTFHNIMSIKNNIYTRFLRLVMDICTRPLGLYLLLKNIQVSSKNGLPMTIQLPSYLGSFTWFFINWLWFKRVIMSTIKHYNRNLDASLNILPF